MAQKTGKGGGSKRPGKKRAGNLKTPRGRKGREAVEEAWETAFRPIRLAAHLGRLRNGEPPDETAGEKSVAHLKRVIRACLLLHLPPPQLRGYKGNPEEIRSVKLLQTEARGSCAGLLLDAVRKRLGMKKPKNKSVPRKILEGIPPQIDPGDPAG